jgi:hypothetical protein
MYSDEMLSGEVDAWSIGQNVVIMDTGASKCAVRFGQTMTEKCTMFCKPIHPHSVLLCKFVQKKALRSSHVFVQAPVLVQIVINLLRLAIFGTWHG